jgi:DnaJ-class molecular chaperone
MSAKHKTKTLCDNCKGRGYVLSGDKKTRAQCPQCKGTGFSAPGPTNSGGK